MSSRTSFAFFGTVYNNNFTIDFTFNSLIKVIDLLPDVEFEFSIVDNYSSDGTFEKLIKYKRLFTKKSNVNIFNIIRKKSNRGLGRKLSLLLTNSKYVIPIDFDCIYKSNIFANLIKDIIKYKLKCVLIGNEGLYYICYRDWVIDVGNYRDLNFGEDTDLLIRLCCFKQTLALPIRVSYNIGSYMPESERRYASGFSYLLRSLNNFIDKILVGGYTPRKQLLRYKLFYNKNNLILTLLRSLIAIPLQLHPMNISKYKDSCGELKYIDGYTFRDLCIIKGIKNTPYELLKKYFNNFEPQWKNIANLINYYKIYKYIVELQSRTSSKG